MFLINFLCLWLHFQLAKKMEAAVEDANKPFVAPQVTYDDNPSLNGLAQMVVAGMKKFPESQWLSLQCQVLNVFRYNSEKVATNVTPSSSAVCGEVIDLTRASYRPPTWQQQEMYNPVMHQPTGVSGFNSYTGLPQSAGLFPHSLPQNAAYQHVAGLPQSAGIQNTTGVQQNLGLQQHGLPGAAAATPQQLPRFSNPAYQPSPSPSSGQQPYFNALTINTGSGLSIIPCQRLHVSECLTTQANTGVTVYTVATGNNTPQVIEELKELAKHIDVPVETGSLEDISSSEITNDEVAAPKTTSSA